MKKLQFSSKHRRERIRNHNFQEHSQLIVLGVESSAFRYLIVVERQKRCRRQRLVFNGFGGTKAQHGFNDMRKLGVHIGKDH